MTHKIVRESCQNLVVKKSFFLKKIMIFWLLNFDNFFLQHEMSSFKWFKKSLSMTEQRHD